MQEIRTDGSLGERKEGTIDELLELAEESLNKEDVAAVVISKGEQDPAKQIVISMIPGRKKTTSGLTESRIREIVREEIMETVNKEIILHAARSDPSFKKILKEIKNGKG